MKKLSIIAAGLLTLLAAGTASATFSNVLLLSAVEVDSFNPASQAPANQTATFLTFAGTVTGAPTCSHTQAIVTGSVDNVKAITSLATAAFLAGKSVRANFTGGCPNGFVAVDSLIIQ